MEWVLFRRVILRKHLGVLPIHSLPTYIRYTITFEDPRCYDKKNLNVQQTLVTQYADFESRISPAENRLTLQSIDLLKCFKRARTRKLTTYAFL